MEKPMTMEEYRRIPDWIRMEARISKPNTPKPILDWYYQADEDTFEEINSSRAYMDAEEFVQHRYLTKS